MGNSFTSNPFGRPNPALLGKQVQKWAEERQKEQRIISVPQFEIEKAAAALEKGKISPGQFAEKVEPHRNHLGDEATDNLDTAANQYILNSAAALISDQEAIEFAQKEANGTLTLNDRFAAFERNKPKLSFIEFNQQNEKNEQENRKKILQSLMNKVGIPQVNNQPEIPEDAPKSMTLEEALTDSDDTIINELGVRVRKPAPPTEAELEVPNLNKLEKYKRAEQDINYSYVLGAIGDADFIAKANKGAKLMKDQTFEQYTFLTPGEKAVYDYYIAENNREGANKFLQTLNAELMKRIGEKSASDLDKIKNPVLRWLAKGGTHVVAGYMNGIENIGRAGLTLSGKTMSQLDYAMASPSIFDYTSQASLERSGDGARMIGQIMYAAGEMAPGAALSVWTGPVGMAGYTFTSSLGNAYVASLREGKSDAEAFTTGMLTAAVDASMQYVAGSVGAKAGSAVTKPVKAKLSNVIAKTFKNPTVAGAANAFGQFAVDVGAQGFTNYSQQLMTPLIRNMVLGEKNEVNPFSEDALQALFIGCVLGGIYKISDMPKNYQAQKMGTALLQSKSAANGLMEMAGGSASPEVKNALGAYRKDGSPMALGNLLMAVQKEQGLAPTVATRRGNTTVLGEAKSLEPSMEDLVAYLHEKGEMGAPSTQMYAARKRVDGLLGNGNLSAEQAEWIAGTPNLAKAFSKRTGVNLDGLSPAEAKARIMQADRPGFTSMGDSGMMFDEKLDDLEKVLNGYGVNPNDNLGNLDWNKIVSKKGESRLEHINKHAKPNAKRTTHGVFNGNPQSMIESAWLSRGNITPIDDGMGGKIYNIPYYNAGYESGSTNTGAKMNYITIIVMDGTTDIITAFPSFGDFTK